MTNKVYYSILVFICCAVQLTNAQQITVDNTISPQQLIEDNLVQGCVETSNIMSPINGSVNGISSFGYFERGNSNFPFENGIVLSTGNAASAGNTTNTNVLNEGETNWQTDPDLENALGITNTLNATTIEFDFVSISNQIQFNYILASEEYFGNFPCQYSDGFAFLIRPASSTGPYTNIAVIPGTNIPVNTSTIHDEIVGFCDAENEEYFDGYNVGDTNYNGRTQMMTATATIAPNVMYSIKLVIADQTDENYDSAVFIEGNSFDATVDLGDDITTCADEITINGDIQNPNATYAWYRNGTLLNGQTTPSLTVTESGSYRIEITILLNGTTCVIEDTVDIQLSSEQTAGEISDYELCDDLSGDGVELFDLSTKTNEVLNAVPTGNYSVSYHLSASTAEANIGSITAAYQNSTNPQTIYVRIEDTDSGCLAYGTFNLIVNPLPVITNPTPIVVCDDSDNDGFTEIDLTQSDTEITGGNPDLVVSYHTTQDDANTGNNPIASPYTNLAATDNLFVRVVDSNTGCVSTTTLSVTVHLNPVLVTTSYTIDACDPDHDGYADFDLTEAEALLTQGLTNITVTYHTTTGDAITGENPIDDPTSFVNTNEDLQSVYIRIVDNLTGCSTYGTIRLYTNILLSGTAIGDYAVCDDDSNDEIEAFDLVDVQTTIVNNFTSFDVIFYETQSDLDNQANPIDENTPYFNTSNPQTLYIELVSDDCAESAEINLIVNPAVIIPAVNPIDYCDTDDDGFTTIELSTFDTTIANGDASYEVIYYASQDDANNDENSLPDFYDNTSNPQLLFARVINPNTGCFDIVDFQLNIIPAPTATQPSDIAICDDDQDATTIVDLDAKIPEMVTDTTNLTISFYTSEINAEEATDAITNTSNFSTQTQTIYTRIESTITTCFTIVPIEIIVNTLPIIPTITNYQICETNYDQVADFLFSTKDLEILNGQTDKDVLYFETEADANARINSIDKNANYQNTSSPQTIYVRIENLTDQNCYDTASFSILVDPIPVFNAPLDWFVCDDASNDGTHTFDLNDKIAEITDGITDNLVISFYTSFENADNSANAIDLEFNNTQNPQQIYTRIENGSNCYTIAEFGLNVIQSPETNPSVPLEVCDDDYDGISTFDLTISELDILNIRQDFITVTYYETIEDVENQTDEITNPETYNNISNPQTVYIRITNTISGCYIMRPLDLLVNLPPAINPMTVINFCESVDNTFQLSEVTPELMDDITGVAISYYESQADAEAIQNMLSPTYTYTNPNTTLFIRAENITTGCFRIEAFNVLINDNPIANTPDNLGACDDDDDEITDFDLTLQTSMILGTQNPANHNVTYHETETDAITGNNAVDTDYVAFNEQIIYVRIENTSTGCYDTTEFLAIVNPLPIIPIDDIVTICLDALPLPVSAETANAGDTYLWSTGETASEIEIDTIGMYAVTVTTEFGCETTKNFEVIQSEAANIEFTETIDFSDPNNIIVTVSGIGNYAYILDDGEPQTSNIFENVTLGYHTITVIDLNGCTKVTKNVAVVDAPKFFTPNNDGYNDTWHISGVETLPGTTIIIYDRYGKPLHNLNASSPGWDGTYNGKMMPTSDYWFLADVKKGEIAFQVKGHFTLKH